jgi:universal stress protein E
MFEPKRILVVVDPTAKEQPAAERAAWLAKRMKAALHLFICDYSPEIASHEFFDARELEKARIEILRQHEQNLEKLADVFRANGLEVSVSARWDSPLHEAILRQIAELKPDMVAKDTHYHNVIKRALLTNTDWNLIRTCPVPLLLVKPHEEPHEKISILAAIDPLHKADKPGKMDQWILEAAKELQSVTHGDLHVVHAIQPALPYVMSADGMGVPIAPPTEEMVESMRIQHARSVEQLLGSLSIETENVHILDGDPRDVLIREAETLQADIVVLGAVARGALGRLLLGSTAEQIMDRIPSDLLIVKPPNPHS